jgi:signal transduction histidine kinase
MPGLRLRHLGPVALVALALVLVCTLTAASLLRQQAAVTRGLRENLDSRRAAVELEECVRDLIALEDAQVETVAVLHDRVQALLGAVERLADQPDERRLYDRLVVGFAAYLADWQRLPPAAAPGHEAARRAATRRLEAEVLQSCQELERFNARQIDQSTETHERVLDRLAWGMAGVGGLGGVAGVVLGYGVARALGRSIRRLRVRLQHAAGKLGADLPEIVLTGEGDFAGLHAEVDRLSDRIEAVVAALQQRETEVLRAEQLAAVGQLAAGVGHELRNPLTSVKLLVQAGLEDGALPADDLRVIDGEVRRMEQSLQTFLDFARPPRTERRPTPLAPLVREVADLLRGRADKQKVAVRLDLPAADLTVPADREQLRQVLVNLFLNALDAMPAGGTLEATVRPSRPGRVQLEVADTGPGISREQLPRLFQPFASTKDTGLGLGLVISKRIVEAHAGTLGAANRRGRGASFFVTLPSA